LTGAASVDCASREQAARAKTSFASPQDFDMRQLIGTANEPPQIG
jgi:hypothetical protein